MMDVFEETSDNSYDLSQICGITPGFLGYLKSAVKGKILETKCIKEFGEKVLLSLTFSCKPVGENGGKRTIPCSRQRQTPSRRKRDQARFHAFLEKKKQIKLEKRKAQLSRDIHEHTSSQCPPPQDETNTQSPTVSITPVESDASTTQFTIAQSEPQKESSNIPVVVDSVQSQPSSPSTVYSDSEVSPSDSSWARDPCPVVSYMLIR